MDTFTKKSKKNTKEKNKTPENTENTKVNFDPELNLTILGEEEISEIILNNTDLFEDVIVEEYLQEVMTVAGRYKRRQQMRRYKAKMSMARRRAMKRRATAPRLNLRARRSAISNVKRRLAGGRSASSLTFNERIRVEKLAKRRKNSINRQTRRLIIRKRVQERNRLSKVKNSRTAVPTSYNLG